jgi:LPS export ABC transporter protein LptC
MMPFRKKLNRIPKAGNWMIALLLLSMYSCENDLTQLPGNGNLRDLDADRASEVTFIYSEKGVTKAKLYTKEFVGNETAKPSFIDFNKGVRMELFNDSLKIENVVTAKTARYYSKEGNVIAKDSVVARNAKGDKLETEELIWNRRLSRFYTNKPVKITANGQVTLGQSMEANQDFSNVKIENQRGSIPVNNNDLPTE